MMTRERFNELLKEWQIWRQNPDRKMPNKLFRNERYRAYTVFNETFFTGKPSTALQPVQHVGVVAKVVDDSNAFRSTAASQWSTMTEMPPYRTKLHPLKVHRDSKGAIRSIVVNTSEIKQQLNHWNWLLHNPRLVIKIAQRSYERRQRLHDSALFL